MAVDIDSLQIEIEVTSSDAASKIEQLATALTNLKSAAKGGAGLTTTTKQLQALSNAAKLINGTNLNSQKIQQFASAMNSLSTIQKASGLNSTINALKKLPEISTALDKADLGKFAQQMNQVASAMRPLATEMQRVANGFSAFPIRIQRIISSNAGLAASNNSAANSFNILGNSADRAKLKFGIYLIAFRKIASVISNWVKESNDYVENLNLFTVAMGEYAESAKAYAEEVQALTGIDSSEWMRNQGVFMQMASGFGVASDSAALMSKNLTQLGYDISSFYNISIEEAMQKLQSGLAGEIEPLRRLGYAIDVASLQQVALNHGITESVNAMTQAEKSQLRYIAIMEQSTNAMGDLSRTIQTPSNAIRILNQQIVQLRRALGNMLIPILQQVIPWVQAFVEVLTEAAQAIANFLGFELPTIDYSGLEGVAGGATDASDALDDAAEAAKKLQDYTLGIDELNVISPQSGGGGGGISGTYGDDWGLELPEYNFLDEITRQTDELKEKLEPILRLALDIGTAILGWRLSSKLFGWLSNLLKLKNLKNIGIGITLAITGVTILMDNIRSILSGEYSADSLIALVRETLGGALIGAGLMTAGVAGAWIIPIAAILSIAVSEVIVNWDNIKSAFSGLWDGVKDLFKGDVSGFWDGVGEFWYQMFSADSWLNNINRWLVGMTEEEWNESMSYYREHANETPSVLWELIKNNFNSGLGFVENIFSPIVNFFDGLREKIKQIWGTVADWFHTNVIQPIVNFFKPAVDTIEEIFTGCWIVIQAVWKTVSDWFQTNVIQPVTGFFTQLWEDIKSIWGTASEWFNANVIQPITGFFRGIWENVSGFFTGLWEDIKEIWAPASGWFNETVVSPVVGWFKQACEDIGTFFTDLWKGIKNGVVSAMNAVIGAVESAINWIIDAINTAINGFNSLVSWGAEVIGVSWTGLSTINHVNLGRIDYFASGGYPETGQMFLAREAGPELVGTIGNRTAVANNDQIVSGIQSGVAQANEEQNSLLREQNELLRAILAKEGRVQISGKAIKRAYDNASRQSGVTIMAGGVMA